MTGAALKGIAVVSMIIDHVGAIFFDDALWMRSVGRIAMPIFVFFIAEGYAHTRSRLRYLARLLVFALLSELPFDLAFFGGVDNSHQNIMFTFALSVAALMTYDVLRGSSEERDFFSFIRAAAAFLMALSFCLPAYLLRVDYSFYAVIAVLLFYVLRNREQRLRMAAGVGFLAVTRTYGCYAWTGVSILPLLLYNGKRGKKLKWFFYLFYPGHLLILHLIDICCVAA